MQPARQCRHHLLRANAREHLLGAHVETEAPADPAGGRGAQTVGADRRRVARGEGGGVVQRSERDLGHRVDRIPHRAVDDATGDHRGETSEGVEPVVRVRRRDETDGGHPGETNGALGRGRRRS
jgi:hypothetical protein